MGLEGVTGPQEGIWEDCPAQAQLQILYLKIRTLEKPTLPQSITQVQPPLEFIPAAFDPFVLKGVQLLLPFWLQFRVGITSVRGNNLDSLVELYRQFQSGKVRFLLAFRHSSANDPFCMASLLWQMVPREARRQGISLQRPLHSYFIYDRGIPLWAGRWVGWLYSRLGGIPIHRGKVDRLSLRSTRNLFANGSLPLAAAPEGATNGHNEVVSPLEPGIAQLGFWCVEDLRKAERCEQVLIVPVGIQYHYVKAPWKALEKLLSNLEADCGLPVAETPERLVGTKASICGREAACYRRVYRLGEYLLSSMEEFYSRFYHQTLPAVSTRAATNNTGSQDFTARLQALLDAALNVAEQYFHLQPQGSTIERCRRLEQAGWDYIYREDLKSMGVLPPLKRGLADWIAAEADLRMWHMRLVESFVAVTGKYVQEKPTVERFAETTLLMWDMITRIKGGNPFQRPHLGKQWVQVTVGQPLSVSDRWETYQTNRRSAKQAVTRLTQDLQIALEAMIS